VTGAASSDTGATMDCSTGVTGATSGAIGATTD
jgi:hypothetical protein